MTISQGFSNGSFIARDGHVYRDLYLDYESLSLELQGEWSLAEDHAIGLACYGIAYYPGIFDAVIQSFHFAFGFPNNLRESFPANTVKIDLPTSSGSSIQADGSSLALRDLQIHYAWQALASPDLNLCLRLFLSLPPPPVSALMRSRPASISPAFYLSAPVSEYLNLRLNGALALGFDGNVEFQSVAGARLMIAPDLDLCLDVSFKTSPMRRLITDSLKYAELYKPNADLVIGFAWQPGDTLWTVHVQEDPFSHNAADVSMSIGMQTGLTTRE